MENKKYKHRLVDEIIKNYLSSVGAIEIKGPKWCGKTWTGTRYAKEVFDLSDPTGKFANKKFAFDDPYNAILNKLKPLFIDEWQEVPEIWDTVKYIVSKDNTPGQFIMSGSSTPKEKIIMHSGAGRIFTINMRPMSLQESNESSCSIKLNDLFNDSFKIKVAPSKLNYLNLATLITRGGWPEIIERNMTIEEALNYNKSYINRIASTDISRVDEIKRNKNRMLILLKSMARNAATYVSTKTIVDDTLNEFEIAKPTSNDNSNKFEISRPTASEYLDVLKKLFVVEEIFTWSPNVKSKTKIRTTTKKIFVDPSLAVASLNINSSHLINDAKLYGSLFENLVLRDLLIYCDSIGANLYQYRNENGLEVDAIVEKNAEWGGIEIKLGNSGVEKAIESLLALSKKITKDGGPKPKFLAVIVGVNGVARKTEDGIYIIPFDCLGA